MMLKAPFDLSEIQPTVTIHCVQAQFMDGRTAWIGPFDNDDDSGSFAAQMKARGLCFAAYRNRILSTDPAYATTLTQPDTYIEQPYRWEPTQADWDDLNSRPNHPSPIVDQEYAPVFHWSNPNGN